MSATRYYQTHANTALTIHCVPQAQCKAVLEKVSAADQTILTAQAFEGALGQIAICSNTAGQLTAIYLGLGNDRSDNAYIQALSIAATRLPTGNYQLIDPIPDRALLAWSLAQYRFCQFKTSEEQARILVVSEKKITRLQHQANAIYLVRDLINTPTNHMGPSQLANVVKQLANTHGALFQEWVNEDLLSDNFPAIHAVGRAADDAPRLLSLTWGDETHPRVTLVGKGVCFDSGGLDIKPASGMRLMKKDMGGAAQVIGLAQWLMSEQLPIRLQVLIPAVENAIGSKAYRPGDVLTMRNGLTVEIDNTDAEGRLILADALVRACEEKPDLLFDFATLTGAARIAVGTEISAMFSNNEQLTTDLMRMANQVADPVWPLPLYDGYNSLFESNIADMANSSTTGYAGAIVAALFLQRFISDVPWVHFDVMAWNLSTKPGKPEGGEAMGILTLGTYLIERFG